MRDRTASVVVCAHVITTLLNGGDRSARDVAEITGLHENVAKRWLQHLAEAGFVREKPAPGRRADMRVYEWRGDIQARQSKAKPDLSALMNFGR